ncbi:MAG: heme ABC transporter ATP-binding protein [Clostridia bacterium]|nr:heme ABC transporter ATP-binding protein [Clostridia bacterium]
MSVKIDVHNLFLSYGEQNIIDNLTLAVEKGEFLALLGPNGSGKSTLIKLLAKTMQPSRGSIYLGGEDLSGLNSSTIARQMAVVPQDTGVNFPFTAQEVVMMGRTPHLKRFQSEGVEDYRIVHEAMVNTRTWELRDRPVTELSGGERQRVIIARALAQEPKVILLDEPTSHLDINFQVELLELLTLLNREKGVGVIAVLHDLNLAAQYSRQVALLKEGKIFALGTPQEALTADNIKEVYATEVLVWSHPMKNCPQVSVVGKEKKATPFTNPFKVFLICGGGVGMGVMEGLTSLGCQVWAGVLNMGDSDWVHGNKLNLSLVEEVPFAPIGEEAFRKAKEVIGSMDVVALLEFPIGPGNLINILLAEEALRRGIPTYVAAKDAEARDYTGGQGAALIASLCAGGSVVIDKGSDMISIIRDNLGK